MRLQLYLNEARYRKIKFKKEKKRVDPFVRIQKAEKIVEEILTYAQKNIKNKSTISFTNLLKLLNSAGKRHRIEFVKSTKPSSDEWVNYKYVGTGCTNYEGNIEIRLVRGAVSFFRLVDTESLSDMSSEFAREFVGVLGHELIHRAQFQKYGFKVLNSTVNVDLIKNDYSRYVEYLKQSHEMMAYAQDAAYELLRDKNPDMFYLYQNYFSETEPHVFTKFISLMKKAYKKISDGEELEIEPS